MPAPNPVCNVINEVSTEKLLCCGETNCRVNENSLLCAPPEYLTYCHDIGNFEICQQTVQGSGICQYKNDKNKPYCVWAEKELYHPANDRIISERNFTEGTYAPIYQRQRAWIVNRYKLEEASINANKYVCCDTEKCACCVTKVGDCSTFLNNSLAITCHNLFNPFLNTNARRHCVFAGVENGKQFDFYVNYPPLIEVGASNNSE